MLAISAAGHFMSAPGQSYSVSAFNDPMRGALEISKTDFSLAYGFATILSGSLLPFVGRIVDRVGARIMLPLVAFFLGIGCFRMSTVKSLPDLYVGFSCVRCLGQGALTLIATWIIGEWFERKRGFATALSGIGGSVSVMSFPILNGYLISAYGWRTTWQILAVMVWGILVVPSLIFLKNRPEDIGQRPDGRLDDDDDVESQVPKSGAPTQESWTISEVLKDPTFWKLMSVPVTSGLVCTGLIFHQVALLDSRGVSSEWALRLISLQATIATLAALFAGWLTDRVENRFLMSAAMAMLATAMVLVITMPHPLLAILYAALIGLHGSILRSAGTVVWVNFYGREHQGAIRGLAFSMMIFASACGPLPLAISVDYFKTWDIALAAFLILPLFAMFFVWSAKQPTRKKMR